MRNIKAEQTEQFSWCINFSQFAQAMIIITVNSIISSNLLLLQFSSAFPHIFLLRGRQQEAAHAVAFRWGDESKYLGRGAQGTHTAELSRIRAHRVSWQL